MFERGKKTESGMALGVGRMKLRLVRVSYFTGGNDVAQMVLKEAEIMMVKIVRAEIDLKCIMTMVLKHAPPTRSDQAWLALHGMVRLRGRHIMHSYGRYHNRRWNSHVDTGDESSQNCAHKSFIDVADGSWHVLSIIVSHDPILSLVHGSTTTPGGLKVKEAVHSIGEPLLISSGLSSPHILTDFLSWDAIFLSNKIRRWQTRTIPGSTER